MQLTHPYSYNGAFNAIERYIRIILRYQFFRYMLFGVKKRAIKKTKAFYHECDEMIERILSANITSMPVVELNKAAEYAAGLLLQVSDLHADLEKVYFFESEELKKIAEANLNSFFRLERELRYKAFAIDENNPDDSKLMEFNASTSRNLLHQNHEL